MSLGHIRSDTVGKFGFATFYSRFNLSCDKCVPAHTAIFENFDVGSQ